MENHNNIEKRLAKKKITNNKEEETQQNNNFLTRIDKNKDNIAYYKE